MQPAVINNDLFVGRKIYFEDENYQGTGSIFYLPTQEEQDFQNQCCGENCLSVKPARTGKARFVPISQIILL